MEAGHPPIYETPEDLEEAVKAYFNTCGEFPVMKDIDGKQTVITDSKGQPVMQRKPATTAGLAFFLGYESRQSLYDQTKRKKDAPRFSYIIKRAILAIENQHEMNLTIGTGGVAVGSIFWMKNHGWTDKPEGKDPAEGEPPMRIHISGKPDLKDIDPAQNDNLEISKGRDAT